MSFWSHLHGNIVLLIYLFASKCAKIEHQLGLGTVHAIYRKYQQKNTEEAIAKLLAQVIKNELSVAKLPKGKYKEKLISTLYEKAPPRTELRYQTDRGVDAAYSCDVDHRFLDVDQ